MRTPPSSHTRSHRDNEHVDKPRRLRLDPLGLVSYYADRPLTLLIWHLRLARWLAHARADAFGRLRARHAEDVLVREIAWREHEVKA